MPAALARTAGTRARRIPADLSSRYAEGARLMKTATVAPKSWNAETRTFEAVVATEFALERWPGIFEILRCTPEAADLRLLAGGPLLDSHNRSTVKAILGTVEDAWITGGKVHARFRLSASPEGEAAAARIDEGTLKKISVGYRVLKASERKRADGVYEVTVDRWEPYEVSLVAVPADPNAKIRSAERTSDMRRRARPNPRPNPVVADDIDTIHEDDIEATHEDELDGDSRTRGVGTGTRDGRQARRAFDRQLDQLRNQAIAAGLEEADVDETLDECRTISAARTRVFDMLADASLGVTTRSTLSERGHTRQDTRQGGGNEAIVAELTARLGGKPPEGARPFARHRLVELGRHLLETAGVSTRGLNDADVADRMLTQTFVRAHSVTDFPSLLLDSGQRVLEQRFPAYRSPLKTLSRLRNVRDYRKNTMIRPGEAPMLDKIAENGEITFGTFDTEAVEFAVKPYARAIGFSRQSIINDDLGALSDFLMAFAQSAAARESVEFFALLSANSFAGATLKDGNPFFHSTRNNKAASGAAPNVTTLGAARMAMRLHKNVNGSGMAGVTPAVLLVGPALETVAEQLVASLSPATTDDVNPFAGKLSVEVENQYAGNGWWLFADPQTRPAFTHGYLDGYEGPRVKSEEVVGRQGTVFTCELDFGAAPLDWRAAYFNPGAG